MSHNSTFGLQSPAAARSYSFQFKPLSSANSHIQPVLQQADKPLYETGGRVQEPGPASYQVPQSNPQVDWIIETLHQETSKHNETRLTLQSTRKINLQLEQLLYQERTFNHALRVNVQEAEMKRIYAEGRLRAYEQQSLYIESSVPTPLSDYKSATFSPSINLTLPSTGGTTSETSGGKRKAYLTTRTPATSKRQKTITSPVTDPESEEE